MVGADAHAHAGSAEADITTIVSGKKVYDLKGINIYRLSGGLVGLIDGRGSDNRLDRDSGELLPVMDSRNLTSPGIVSDHESSYRTALRKQYVCAR